MGFQFEVISRQAMVHKGRSRDTAWFSMLDSEWPQIRERFVHWFDGANFDEDGRQRAALGEIRLP